MRKLLIFAFLIALASSLAFADGAAVAIQNEEEARRSTTSSIRPTFRGSRPGARWRPPGSRSISRAKSTEPPFTALPPGGAGQPDGSRQRHSSPRGFLRDSGP